MTDELKPLPPPQVNKSPDVDVIARFQLREAARLAEEILPLLVAERDRLYHEWNRKARTVEQMELVLRAATILKVFLDRRDERQGE